MGTPTILSWSQNYFPGILPHNFDQMSMGQLLGECWSRQIPAFYTEGMTKAEVKNALRLDECRRLMEHRGLPVQSPAPKMLAAKETPLPRTPKR